MRKIGDAVYIKGNESCHDFNLGEKIKITKVEDQGTKFEHYFARSLERPNEGWLVSKNDVSANPVEEN